MIVPVVLVSDPGPWSGTAVVLVDESGLGSLWIDHAFHGEIPVPPEAVAAGELELPSWPS